MSKRSFYCDIEVFPNYFCVTFIDINIDRNKMQEFIDLDIHLLSQELDRYEYEHNEELWQNIQQNIKPIIFEVYDDLDESLALAKFLDEEVNYMFTYNGERYDTIILDLISNKINNNEKVTCTTIFGWSTRIVNNQDFGHPRYQFSELSYYIPAYINVDLMTLNYLDKNYISLKQINIILQWYKVQDYELPHLSLKEYRSVVNYTEDSQLQAMYKLHCTKKSFLRYVIQDHIPGIHLYNINDCLSMIPLHDASNGELKTRIFATNKYSVPLRKSICASRSKLADILLIKFYEGLTNQSYSEFRDIQTNRNKILVGDCIVPAVGFTGKVLITAYSVYRKTSGSKPVYNKILHIKNLVDFNNMLKSMSIRSTNDVELVLTINNLDYTFASGGLHSKDKPSILQSTNEYVYKDADVSSYYPNLVVKYGIKPEHLTTAFIAIAKMIVDERLKAKSMKNVDPDMKNKADILKIVANSGIFGKFGSEYSWLKDMKALVSVTFNGELMLLMLIEDLETAGISVISANTDGIVAKIPIGKRKIYDEICSNWEKRTKMPLEFTEYDKYIRRDVNHYIALTKDGKVKRKGNEFNPELELLKGYKYPVIAMAIENHFLYGKNIKEFIKNHDNILDFCISQKVGGEFTPEFHYISDGQTKIKILQKNIRYYVSNGGGVLMKKYSDEKIKEQRDKALADKKAGKKPKAVRERISLIKNRYCTIINNLFYVNKFEDYDIDYNFYFAEADKTWQAVNGQLNIHKATSKVKTGFLFDDF